MSEPASSVESVSSSLSAESADAASGVRWPAAAASAGWVRWLAQHERLTAAPPLAAALLLLVTIGAAFWYLSAEEARRETQAVRRELEFGQQHLRVRLHEQQAQLERLGREWTHEWARAQAGRPQAAQGFVQAARAVAGRYSEILTIRWLDAQQRVRLTTAAGAPDAAHAAGAPQELAAQAGQEAAAQAAFALAQSHLQPAYAVALAQPGQGRALAEGDVQGDMQGNMQGDVQAGGLAADAAQGHAGLNVLHLYLPLLAQGRFAGALHVAYSADGLLRYGLPAGLQGKYAVALKDEAGRLLAGHGAQPAEAGFDPGRWLWGQPPQQARLALAEHGPELVLQAQPWRAAAGVGGRALFWTAAALSLMTLWMLGVNWHYLRQRQRAQAALLAEVGFRHAIENSMRTGMRTVDGQGRITYVNRAFCEMTGWSEAELLGQTPPYSYWPQADREWLGEQLWRQMRGQIDAHGLSMRAQRKNGTIFDARIYLAPLVDSAGRQNGWVASMTDISEPNRVRRELSASHDRFAAVLDALDTAVSVAPLGSQELLFANRQYRQWFDATTQGHLSLLHNASLLRPAAARMDADAPVNEAAAAEPASAPAARAEIFLPEQNRWLEVRSRYLSWVDGRLAQMVIATDITARRQAEQRAQEQAQRAEDASRLITMGEMASSVAHELNQPLTAISNYCTGIISRLREGGMDEAALLGALEKVARQAQRAGMVIQHIRNFVKRSEPRMQATSAAAIAEPVLELAEVEARRHRVQLSSEIAPDLPALRADPILIGQVLLNLIRNSAEAIDTAQRPDGQRRIALQASLIQIEDVPAVQFAVQDSGCGLPPGVQERLYEAFFSTKHDGMGIGLNLCRSIIEAHQGRMHVANLYNLGQVAGCRFSFWIPVTLAPDDPHAAGLAPAALPGANRTPPRPPFSEPDPT